MKQPDFFRLFSEKMQGATPPPDHSAEDWLALQNRLDAHDRKRWRVLPLGWLAGLTGLLLLSNLGWFFLWKKTDDKLTKRHSEQPLAKPTAVTVRDTVFEKTVVYQYDTIYRTVVMNRMAAGQLAQNYSSQRSSSVTLAPQGATTKGVAASTISQANNGQLQVPEQINTATTTDALSEGSAEAAHSTLLNGNSMASGASKGQMATPDALPSLAMRAFPNRFGKPVLQNLEDFPVTPLKESTTAFPLIPRSFSLGIGAGSMFPRQASITSSSEKAATLSAEIGFSDHLALMLDGTVGAFAFRGFREDPSLGLPKFIPPGDEYDLRYFETHDETKNIVQFSAGMRWYLLVRSKLNPWLGASWTTQWNPSYELEVEYVHRQTGTEKSKEVEVPAMQKPLNYAGFNLGLRYQLATHWELQAGSFWDFKASSQAGIGRWWGIRGGVGFRF